MPNRISNRTGKVLSSTLAPRSRRSSSGNIQSLWAGVSVPNAPTGLSGTPATTTVSVAFTAPSDNGGEAITNYQYSLDNVTYTALSPADAVTPVTVSGLTANTNYTLYLKAVNAVGAGAASSVYSFTTTRTALSYDVLVVGGGGGGGMSAYPFGAASGAGGGGLTQASSTLTAGSYLASVGGGGGGGNPGPGAAGGASSFNGATAAGGGEGLHNGQAGGASGGGTGAGGNPRSAGGAGGYSDYSGGGQYYGGGGGGSSDINAGNAGAGGAGGGGNGANVNNQGGFASYYGGGGGAGIMNGNNGLQGGNGYQGIVIVRYLTSGINGWTISGGSAATVGSYVVRTFTGSDYMVLS